MSVRSLGQLTLDLVAKTGAFTAGMTAAERQTKKSFQAMNVQAVAFGTVLGNILSEGINAAARGLKQLVIGSIEAADALRDSSIQLGISTETLSAYGYAAQQTGTDLDGLSRGLKILSKNAADALKPTSEQAKIFDALGISVTDAAGNLRELDDLVPDIADAFSQLEDGTQKAALAQALFGKSGLELTEFLNSGSKGLEEFTEKARELGIIVGTDTANAADEFNDKLGDLKALVSGFGNQLAAELLPRLIELVDYFNQAAKEGNTLGTSVKDLGTIFDLFIGEVKKADEVGDSFRAMLAATTNTVNFLKSGLSDLVNIDIGGFIQKMNQARNAATSALLAGFGIGGNPADFSGVTASVAGRGARNARGGSNRTETGGINQAALSDALAGITEPKGSKGGAKQAKKEVDELDEAYKRLTESMKEEIELFGETTEVAKLRYDLENGKLAELSQAKKDILLAQAEELDQMKLMAELQEAADRASLKESERIQDGIKDTELLLDDMRFELDILNLSNEARERAIFLRGLDADATDEQRLAAGQLFDELERGYEMKGIIDDFKMGLSDAFVDFVTGAKSAKEAFGDFMDDLFKRAVQFTTDKAIDALFSAFGGQGNTGAQSGGGTDWMAIIAGFFGGGKASGGPVKPWSMYEVNESGMEGLTVGGRDYLLTGAKSGMVTPANKMGGAVYNLNNTFVVPPGQRQRTQEQQAQKMGQQVEEITRRNS